MDAGIVLRSLRQRYVPSQSSEPETQIMARIERSIEIEAAIPVVQDVIWNFARYPEFIPRFIEDRLIARSLPETFQSAARLRG